MNFFQRNSGAIAVVALVIAIIGIFTPAGQQVIAQSLGGVSNYDTISASGLQIGTGCNSNPATCGGTTITQILKGTGILIGANYSSLAASSSLPFDIAVTGAVSGDTVFAQFATSSPNGEGWLVAQASASSTSGFITLRVLNLTGTTATIPASIASTTQYLILR